MIAHIAALTEHPLSAAMSRRRATTSSGRLVLSLVVWWWNVSRRIWCCPAFPLLALPFVRCVFRDSVEVPTSLLKEGIREAVGEGSTDVLALFGFVF